MTTKFLTGDGKPTERLYECPSCGSTQWTLLDRAPRCGDCHVRMQVAS